MNISLPLFINILLGTIIAGMVAMKKTIIKRSKLIKALRKLKLNDILPFKEKPCDEVKEEKGKFEASELFSMFTADIIKEDIEFVR